MFHPPTNFVTELAHTQKGVNVIMQNNYVELIIEIISNEKCNTKVKKSGFWILAKLIKLDKSNTINNNYQVIEKIHNVYSTSLDFGLKGCICYIFSYLATNNELQGELSKLGWCFYKGTEIAFYTRDLMMSNYSKINDTKPILSNNFNAETIIQKYITLDSKNEEYYNNFCLLLSNFTYKQALSKLREEYKLNNQVFSNPKLIVKVISLLNNYRYQQIFRQFIFSVLEYGISNVVIMKEVSNMLDALGQELI